MPILAVVKLSNASISNRQAYEVFAAPLSSPSLGLGVTRSGIQPGVPKQLPCRCHDA